MHFSLLLLLPALVFGAKAPTPYKYGYEIRDTTKYKSPFFIFGGASGKYTDGQNIQLRPNGGGNYIPVIDKNSPVLQSELEKGGLLPVTYDFFGEPKKPLGLSAGLLLSGGNTTTKTKFYKIIFSKKMPGSEVGFRGFALFGPHQDGIYSVAATAPFKGAVQFNFALCDRANGTYLQLEYLQSKGKSVSTPPGCYQTFLFSTLAPPNGKPKKS